MKLALGEGDVAAAAVRLAAASAAPAGTGSGPASEAARVARPPIKVWAIPFGPKRKREMAEYSLRHYGQNTWRLRHPHVIVEHMSQTGSAAAVYNTFAPDVPDVELH